MRKADPRTVEFTGELLPGKHAQSNRQSISDNQSNKDRKHVQLSAVPHGGRHHGEQGNRANGNLLRFGRGGRRGGANKTGKSQGDELQARHSYHETGDLRRKEDAQARSGREEKRSDKARRGDQPKE